MPKIDKAKSRGIILEQHGPTLEELKQGTDKVTLGGALGGIGGESCFSTLSLFYLFVALYVCVCVLF